MPTPPTGGTQANARTRTYVAVGYPMFAGVHGPITVLGTVRASNRRVARALAHALLSRPHGRRPPACTSDHLSVRVWAASACRRSWLLTALARDGAAR